MKAVVPQASLLEALQHVVRAVPTSSPLPVMSGMHLHFRRERLTLSASNGILSIRADIPLPSGTNRTQEGSLVVPARYFADIVRKLSAPQVELGLTEPFTLLIRAGGGFYRLCGADPDLFPEQPASGASPWLLTLPNALLKSLIRQVAFAASASDTRPLLTGVWCRCDGGRLILTATDSIRFASGSSLLPPERASGSFEAVIPAKGLNELARLLHDEQGETAIAAHDGHIVFSTANLTLGCALLHGSYPPVDKLVPRSFAAEVTVGKLPMLQAIERVTLLAGEGCVVHLRMMPAAGNDLSRQNRSGTDNGHDGTSIISGERGTIIELLSRSAEIGDVREEILVEQSNGEPLTISFNGKYMADILRAMEGTAVRLRFTSKLAPLAAEPAEPHPSALYLLTPIRTAI
ncbi:DNA polymerase III subunit beta [Paenibacillus hodogayensis]|uniref:Beta sliding clamp n=1 Tax=Paenibacillus hodogayensis TaxID=279208 RepID=A0ABV5VRT9_9BACL